MRAFALDGTVEEIRPRVVVWRDGIATDVERGIGPEEYSTYDPEADERGTEEYNLHLSNRRASTVKRYLVNLGVPEKNLETVGYGENRPADSGHTEDAWAANRRVELRK